MSNAKYAREKNRSFACTLIHSWTKIYATKLFCCWGVRRRTDSVAVFCGSPLGQWRFRFLGQKNREGLTDLDELWPSYRGSPRIGTTFFPTGEIPVTREKIAFRQNFGIFSGEIGQDTVTKISPRTPLGGSHITQSKFRPWPLTILRNLGKTFLGVGPLGA